MKFFYRKQARERQHGVAYQPNQQQYKIPSILPGEATVFSENDVQENFVQ